MASTNPILLIFMPALYALGASFSLLQFQVILALMAKGVQHAKKIDWMEPALPGESLDRAIEASPGRAVKAQGR
jgi:hypothetical protein